ncbi:MAG: adenylate/guanylate cyclase domain-containing protein [Conexivisphaerales archaeon]
MFKPPVRYAKSGDVHIAYQLFGKGRINIVLTPGSISHLDYMWKEPGYRRFLEGLAEFAKVVLFDKRGTGLSDRQAGVPTYADRMDDIRAVMDAAQFDNAVLFGVSEGVPMSILFAASYPSRTKGLILYGGEAKGSWSPDYPWVERREEQEARLEWIERLWGTRERAERAVSVLAPSRIGDEKFIRWVWEILRMGSTPGALIALAKSDINMDVRHVLPTIRIPTLVIHLRDDKNVNIEEGRYIAKHIPGAKMVELEGTDHYFFVDSKLNERILSEAREFMLNIGSAAPVDRMLATVLFTDIVGSTSKAADLGDARWMELLERHDRIVREEVQKNRGVVIKSTGDGFLATFDGPTRALRCVCSIRESLNGLGIQIRAGLHTGECIFSEFDVGGIAVHIASRIMNLASPNEILVSSTVRDLVYGSGISFEDKGEHELKGIEEKKSLFSVLQFNRAT